MSELNLSNYEADGLWVEPKLSPEGAFTVNLAGSATAYKPEGLRRYLQQVHAEALRLQVPEVRVDLNELEFMNSAGFSTLIDWLVALQSVEPEKQYRVRFLSNSRHLWQRRSLNALKCLAVDLVTIDA